MKALVTIRHTVLAAVFFSVGTLLCISANAAPPVANVSRSSNLSGLVPLTAKLDGSLSSCSNGCNRDDSYVWDFGDGNPTRKGKIFERVYRFDRTFTAKFTVTDDRGLKSTASVTITPRLPPGESLTNYVQACQSQLGFSAIPEVDCYDSDLFVRSNDPASNPINDRMGYRKITDSVDLTFACRWLFGSKNERQDPISVEMMVHNRVNGNTCFFSAKGPVSGSNIDPTSGLSIKPSSFVKSPTSSTASTYWDEPSAVNAYIPCIGCHISGPYIATPLIAPYLAKHGLMNNGHDTLSNVRIEDLATPNKNVKYHAVSGAMSNGAPGVFSQWDQLKQSYINASDSACAIKCHVIGTSSPQKDIGINFQAFQPIVVAPPGQLKKINDARAMRPYDDASDYRWINLDSPSDGVESETFAAANTATNTLVPQLFSNDNPDCAQPDVPTMLEAHAVGNDNVFYATEPSKIGSLLGSMPDHLSVFNLKEGLVCLNSDQDSGQSCTDYSISYQCTDATGRKSWVNVPNSAPRSDGDYERRPTGICAGTVATAIKASATFAGGWSYSWIGPNDRLADISQYGLTCNNADQPDGQCSSYVVRYSSCVAPPTTVTKIVSNVFAPGKELTAASNSLVKGQAHNNNWNTQAWAIEPVKNTQYVRLKNTGTNVYLNVDSTADRATVGTAASSTSPKQMWLVEPISGSRNVRLKNVFSGKYLTMADPAMFPNTPDYLPIFSQARNTGWSSQRWVIQ